MTYGIIVLVNAKSVYPHVLLFLYQPTHLDTTSKISGVKRVHTRLIYAKLCFSLILFLYIFSPCSNANIKSYKSPTMLSAVVFFIGFLAWAYYNTSPPPPKRCGLPDGPPVTGPRVTLRDGRHLAYNEYGVSRYTAKFKIVFVHGFSSCRYDTQVYHPVISSPASNNRLFNF